MAERDCFQTAIWAQLFKTNDVVSFKTNASLVNVSLKFQKLISNTGQYFLLKKCEKLLQCKLQKLLSFFKQKYQCIWS